MHRSDQNAGIDIAVQRQHPHRATVPSARVFLQIFDGLRGRFLGRAHDGHRPHVRKKRVQGIEARRERPLHVIHGVEYARVGFDQPPSNHLHRARNRNARFVVAVHVAAHGQLGFFLGGIQQFANAVGVPQRIAGAARGPGDRAGLHAAALHAHEHFGRSADQLLVPQLQQELVRAGTALLDALKQRRSAFGIVGLEGLAQDHFVVFALPHAFSHRFHLGHILGGLVVAPDFVHGALGWPARRCSSAPQARGGEVAQLKIVAKPLDLLLLAIHVINVVAQKQVQIFLAVPGKFEMDRIELEQKIVAECAHQRQPRIQFALKFPDQRAQNRKSRRLLAAFFFWKQSRKGLQVPPQSRALESELLPMRMAIEHTEKHSVQHFTARVQCIKLDIPSGSRDLNRRAHRSHVPARVAFRIFVPGRKVNSAVSVQLVQQRAEAFVVGDRRRSGGLR